MSEGKPRKQPEFKRTFLMVEPDNIAFYELLPNKSEYINDLLRQAQKRIDEPKKPQEIPEKQPDQPFVDPRIAYVRQKVSEIDAKQRVT